MIPISAFQLFSLSAFHLGEAAALALRDATPPILAQIIPVGDLLSFRTVVEVVGGVALVITSWRYLTGQSNAEERTITNNPLMTKEVEEWATLNQLVSLKTEVHNQITELRAYVHQSAHDIQSSLQAMQTNAEDRDETLRDAIKALNDSGEARVVKVHDRVNELAEAMGEHRGDIKHLTSAVQAAAKAAQEAAIAAARRTTRA